MIDGRGFHRNGHQEQVHKHADLPRLKEDTAVADAAAVGEEQPVGKRPSEAVIDPPRTPAE